MAQNSKSWAAEPSLAIIEFAVMPIEGNPVVIKAEIKNLLI